MHLIVCVDERDGLSFCGRRLSQDRKLIDHILYKTAGHRLWMNAYSAKLFPQGSVQVDSEFWNAAPSGDYCFLETSPVLEHYENLESVILYCWNRAYPSTVRFPRSLISGMHLESAEEFSGNSHEKITMERYVP